MKKISSLYFILPVLLSSAFGTFAVLSTDSLQSANDRSRWATVWSLAERNTWHIDEIIEQPGWNTIDKVRHEDHFYSSKPPLFPWLVSIVYRAVKGITGWNLLDHTQQVTRTILLLINLIPMLVAIVLFGFLLQRFANSRFTIILLMLTFGFGTFLTTFQTVLNNHLPAACSLMIAIFALVKIRVEKSDDFRWYLLAGTFAAFLCTNEIPAAPFGVIAFLVSLNVNTKKTLLFFVPAALIPLGTFFWSNYDCTGGFQPFYAFYGTEKYQYIYKGIPSYWMNPGGIDANEESTLSYFSNCTIGHHGIYSLTPIFLLSLGGWFGLRNKTEFPLRFLLWMGMCLTVFILGFYLFRTQNYNYGGKTVGLRWTFWLIPFWLIAMIPVLDRISQSRWKICLASVLFAISVFSSVSSIWHPWEYPWIYRVVNDWGWIDHSSPRPDPFDPPMTTWFRTLPDSNGEKNSWIRFEGVDHDGKPITVEFRDKEIRKQDGKTIQFIEIIQKKENEVTKNTFEIDLSAFRLGEFPADFLISPRSTESIDFSILQGLPMPKRFNRGKVRYLFTKIRDDAFTCRHAAASAQDSQFGNKSTRLRCDIWVCQDVPFGVLKTVWTRRDNETNQVISTKTLQAVECFPNAN